ncbi:MAG: hypothetical protein Q7O66_00010, partial [Dehalococcoidia bacterium]|nr:hypothetical protein [Dehalococcoidia bacterium]
SGALFVINARGEPVHFLCNQVRVTSRFMWREEDILMGACRRLWQSLFSACPVMPLLILCQASEIPEQLFEYELGDASVGCIATGERLEVIWHPRAPAAGTPAFALWERLSTRGLLYEPFTRAAKGMAEMLRTRAKSALPSGMASDQATSGT